jgi:TIR domain
MAFDVFISYPHQDKTTADAACARLEAEGIRCWIAPRDIAPSADWAASIIEAIDNCRLMILIFSGHTNHSRQVGREVQQAFDGEKPVVPFRIENVAPEHALRYYMGSVHWLDALSQPVEQHLQRLTAAVKLLLEATAPGAAPQSGQPPKQDKPEVHQRSDGEMREKGDRAIPDLVRVTEDTSDKVSQPGIVKKVDGQRNDGLIVVRTSGAIFLTVALIAVTAIALFFLVRNALPSHETMTKCITAGGSGGGCGGNSFLYVVATGVVIAAWRCLVWIWRQR